MGETINKKSKTTEPEASFLDLHLLISNDFVFTKIYDKRDDFEIYIVMFLAVHPIEFIFLKSSDQL